MAWPLTWPIRFRSKTRSSHSRFEPSYLMGCTIVGKGSRKEPQRTDSFHTPWLSTVSVGMLPAALTSVSSFITLGFPYFTPALTMEPHCHYSQHPWYPWLTHIHGRTPSLHLHGIFTTDLQTAAAGGAFRCCYCLVREWQVASGNLRRSGDAGRVVMLQTTHSSTITQHEGSQHCCSIVQAISKMFQDTSREMVGILSVQLQKYDVESKLLTLSSLIWKSFFILLSASKINVDSHWMSLTLQRIFQYIDMILHICTGTF